jgi:hypothetical protein
MSVTNNTYVINSLGSTATFYDWFQKENNEIIAKLNLLKAYGVTSGDGVLASTNSNGLVSVSIGGTSGVIQSNLTFNGTVLFNGNVNIPNNIIEITGITSGTTGYTFGTPIRTFLNGSVPGYTASRANNPDNAEVFGYITSRGISSSFVAIDGKINGDFTGVYGKGLSAGVIYFLDSSMPGKITDQEPVVTGYVSKPLFMGLSGDSALILTYRGNYLNADLTSYGSSGSNQIAISIDTSLYSTADSNILLGDVLSYNPEYAVQVSSLGNRINFGGWFHSRDSVFENKYIVGVVIGKYMNGTDLIVSIQLSGYTNVYSSYTDGSLFLTSDFNLSNRSGFPQLINTTSNFGNNTLIAVIYDDASNSSVINIIPSLATTFTGQAASSSSGGTIQNLLKNGNFEVWQRTEIGKNTQYTPTGNVIFADMWRRRDGITGGAGTKNYYISRQTFSEYQTDVEGNPTYYVNAKALSLSAIPYLGISAGNYPGYTANDHLMVGHVIPGAKTLDSKEISISFYAKTSHANYNEVLVYLAKYSGSTLLDYKILGSASLGTNWGKYDFVAFVDSLPSSLNPLVNDYCEIGIDMIPLITQAQNDSVALSTDVHVSLASFNAGIGQGSIRYHSFDTYPEQLEYCQQFYYTTYEKFERVGTPTMISSTLTSVTTPHLVTIPAYPSGVHHLPTVMRITPLVTMYSPYSGTIDEAYNYSAERELKFTSGTIGFGGQIRSAPLGSPLLSVTPAINKVRVNVLNGQVPYDQVYYHFIADSDFPI